VTIGRINGVTKRAQIPFPRIVIRTLEKLPKETPRRNPVITKAMRVSTDADETRRIFVIGFPRTLSFPKPKNATA
jgi:hypothetical protein